MDVTVRHRLIITDSYRLVTVGHRFRVAESSDTCQRLVHLRCDGPLRGRDEEDIEADRLARAALDAEGPPPSRQTEGTSGSRQSPPKSQQTPSTGASKRLKTMARKSTKTMGKLVPPPIKEPLDPEVVEKVGTETAKLIRLMKGQIEASRNREDDMDQEIDELKNTVSEQQKMIENLKSSS
ncbi:hypothetical protein L1987_48324 [Smallanthus sonchifolius]|uniref:Uncharacterized protein n=1 Tax=Smallanthus sonchifolius TaxID=185202 RepID=A0ACB9FSJ6_9ASTR|nr:hypothetical protein L1987_48324 [Smallanthus sonchifolius]